MESSSDEEFNCGYGSSDGEGAEKIDKKTECDYCSTNFEDVDDDNRLVVNPCGCVLHWYCRWKRTKYINASRICPGCGEVECENCKELRSKIKKLTLKNAQLKSRIAGQTKQQEQKQEQQ